MLRFFKTNAKNSQTNIPNPKSQFLANQLEFLNGNYATLLRDPTNGNQHRNWIDSQLDFYLRRFFSKESIRRLVLGGNRDCKYHDNIVIGVNTYLKFQNKTFSAGGIYIDGLAVGRDAMCLLYFVDSLDALKDIHTQTLSLVEEIHECRGHTHPMPPIFIITRTKDSLLNNLVELRKLFDIPIFDSWYLEEPEYHHSNFANCTISRFTNPTWARIMGHIEPIYSQLAVSRGLVYQEVIDNQVEFFLCANQTDSSLQFCQDTQNIVASYLFNYNINKAKEKSEDFTTQPSVTFHRSRTSTPTCQIL